MAKMVASVKTTEWEVKQGSLALFLDKGDYRTVMRDSVATINQLAKPAPVNKAITEFSTQFEKLTLKVTQKFK